MCFCRPFQSFQLCVLPGPGGGVGVGAGRGPLGQQRRGGSAAAGARARQVPAPSTSAWAALHAKVQLFGGRGCKLTDSREKK